MAIERFRRSNAGQVAQMPAIRPVAAEAAGQTAGAFSQAIDRLSRFAFSQAREDYERRAQTEGARLVQEKGAVQAVREINEQGGPEGLAEEVAFEVGNRLAAAQIETMGRSAIDRLTLDAGQNNTPYSEVEQQINDVVLGYTSALEEFSPEAAIEARANLDGSAATAINKYAETFQKRQLEELQGSALAAYETKRQDYIAIATEDIPQDIKRTRLAEEREKIKQLFVDAGFSPTRYESVLTELDKEAVESEILVSFNNLQSPEEKQSYIDNLRQNYVPELGVDGTRILRNNLTAELNKDLSRRQSSMGVLSERMDEFVKITRAGGDVTQEQIDEIIFNAQDFPELEQELATKSALIRNINSFKRMPPAVLEQTINELRGDGIETGFEADMIKEAETMLSNMRSDSEKDPISAYIQYAGADEPVAFRLGNPDEMLESIDKRIEVAKEAANFFGVDVKYLTDSEANQLASYVRTLSPAEKADIAVGMNAMPPEVWQQVAEKEEGVFAMASAIGDSQIALNIFEGQTLIRDKLVDMPSALEQADAINEVIGNVYGEADRKDIIAASRAYYAATASDRNMYDEDEFRSAIQKVTGGIAEINGAKIQLPRGVDEDEFDRFVNNFTPEMVERFGGVQGMSNEEAAEMIRDRQLQSEADNVYIVTQAGAPIMNNNGEPFTVVWDDELRAMARAQYQRVSPGMTRSRVRAQQLEQNEEEMGGP